MRLSYFLISLLGLGLMPTYSLGQRHTSSIPDSLVNYLQTAKQDTTYVRAANQYAWWLINPLGETNRADSLLKRTEVLAKRLNDPMGLQRVYYHQAWIWLRQPFKEQKKALPYLRKAYQIIQQAHLPPSERQRVLSSIGQLYHIDNQFELALKYFLTAIQLTERYKLREYVTRAYIGAGEVMEVTKRYAAAEHYYRKAYTIAYMDQDKAMIAWGESYLAYLLEHQGKYREALPHLQKALMFGTVYSTKAGRIHSMLDISHCYLKVDPVKAYNFLKKTEQYANEIQADPDIKLTISWVWVEYYTLKRQYVSVVVHLKKLIRYAKEENNVRDERDAVREMATVYAKMHQFDKAYHYHVQFSQLTDSLVSNQTVRKIQEIAEKHEIEKREAQIKLLNQQHQSDQFQRNTFLIGGILVLILGLLLGAWLLNRSRLHQLQEAHMLRQQIAHDLHDEVGSTLSSISMLSGHTDTLLRQNQAEQAQKTVQKVYADARQILESIDEIIWTVSPGNDSLHRIAMRLQEYAQPLMESKGIDFQCKISTSLDQFTVSMEVRRNLYLIGKEAINNLIKYSQATKASLVLEYGQDRLMVLLDDNGKGFDQTQLSHRTGQASMQQRANAIGGKLQVRSVLGQGTHIQLVVNT
ncbi:ATP-binding protein [Spirosoma endbachense]|uniref:histidine kinase n=1 Tax=Spirosoma endbachense TaxID=2666025 RepID=A0A6P1W5U8_9BACT|nr:histidine kinase [Spirosoma endbachense]QHV99096.1 sensor protein uhpB [Spirosoma endbachense]